MITRKQPTEHSRVFFRATDWQREQLIEIRRPGFGLRCWHAFLSNRIGWHRLAELQFRFEMRALAGRDG